MARQRYVQGTSHSATAVNMSTTNRTALGAVSAANVNATRESPMRGGAVGLARKLRTGRKIQVSVRRGRESEGSHTTHLHACVSVSLC
jgi:hypothetical protein